MNKENNIHLHVESELFKRREHGTPHTSYAAEKNRHKIIQEGRIDLMNKELLSEPDGTTGILASEELRHWKNMLIVSAALFSRYAIEGGLNEETAYAMSDIYIRKAEDIRTSDESFSLYKQAYFDFTSAVYNQKKNEYSSFVNNTMHYIQIHLHEQISLEQLSKHADISKSHLCRIFKAETGTLLSEYIQKKRIDSAIHMLTHTGMTISAISECLHFSTQSYFISIFKKHCGVTPGVYRKLYHQ